MESYQEDPRILFTASLVGLRTRVDMTSQRSILRLWEGSGGGSGVYKEKTRPGLGQEKGTGVREKRERLIGTKRITGGGDRIAKMCNKTKQNCEKDTSKRKIVEDCEENNDDIQNKKPVYGPRTKTCLYERVITKK